MIRKYYKNIVLIMALLLLLSSCLGLKTGIVINDDGSGSIDLLFTVSETLIAMAEQDGNASEPPLPVSKIDFEKTVSRIEGLSLTSYKTETKDENCLINARFDFANINALISFFDESGQAVSYTENGNKKELVFSFNDEPLSIDADEEVFFTKIFAGYDFAFSLQTKNNMSVSFIDENGNTMQSAPGMITEKNNTVSYEASMADIIFAKEKLIMKILF